MVKGQGWKAGRLIRDGGDVILSKDGIPDILFAYKDNSLAHENQGPG